MSTLTPMFERTKLIKLDDHVKAAERKKRKDKKIQIKVPVTEEQKLQIGRFSLHNGYKGEVQSYLAYVLTQATQRPYIIHSNKVDYKDSGNYASTKVTRDVYNKIAELKVEWGLRSIKQAAYRILYNELFMG
jgi:hypothetical protein